MARSRKKSAEKVLRQALKAPMVLLLEELEKMSELSSLEIARRSGVPASVVRSIRNGHIETCKVSTWSELLGWCLKENGTLQAAA